MNNAQYLGAISAVIPDILESLGATIKKTTAPTTSTNDHQAKDNLASLEEAVQCIQDSIESDGEHMNIRILRALYDEVECCRMLASALSPDPVDSAADTARFRATFWPRRRDEATRIARRVVESAHFLCEIGTLKSFLDQEAMLKQRRFQRCSKYIGEDYLFLTLLLYDRVEKDDETQCTVPRKILGISRASFSNLTQLYSKLRDEGNGSQSLFPWIRNSETRISRSIDKLILKEQQQPSSQSDTVLMFFGTDLYGPLKAGLAAASCENKQWFRNELQKAAAERARDHLNNFMRLGEPSVPQKVRARALELQAQLATTDGDLTDESLDSFEQLWSFEAFNSASDDRTSWLAHRVLGNIRRILQDDYVLTTADMTYLSMPKAYGHLMQLTYGERRVNIVDLRCSESLRKMWRHRFDGLPTVLFVFELTTYDQYCDSSEESTVLKECLPFFENITEKPALRDTTFLLFLVNVTEFGEKLQRIPLSRCIPGFTGDNNPREAAAYILEQFVARMKCRHRLRAHVCDVIDAHNLDFVFSSVDHAMRQRDIKKRLRGFDPGRLNGW